ncbi:MAG: hypothetical protein KC800_08030 [Candidatus Eremiobacteraeota bacterium]|nr:hypothetical protein [Candidatus Eremiobacteraeota bacterium]
MNIKEAKAMVARSYRATKSFEIQGGVPKNGEQVEALHRAEQAMDYVDSLRNYVAENGEKRGHTRSMADKSLTKRFWNKVPHYTDNKQVEIRSALVSENQSFEASTFERPLNIKSQFQQTNEQRIYDFQSEVNGVVQTWHVAEDLDDGDLHVTESDKRATGLGRFWNESYGAIADQLDAHYETHDSYDGLPQPVEVQL